MMRYFQLTNLGVVLTALALTGVAHPASATVIFEENFTTRPAHAQILSVASPNITNTGGAIYTRGPRLADVTVGKIGYYGDQALNVKGLIFQPMDSLNADPQLAGDWGQTMHVPFQYTLGTDAIRLTLVARQAMAPPQGVPWWNRFVFGFSNTGGDIGNFIKLDRNPNAAAGNSAALIELAHNSADPNNPSQNNSKRYSRNYGNMQQGIRSDYFRELVLEYDPNKVNQVGISPYTFIVDGVEIPLIHSSNGSNVPGNLPPMVTGERQNPNDPNSPLISSIQGISWGFEYGDGALDRSVLIQSMKFETFTPEPPSAEGDFDGDGIVDGNDFLKWQRGESTNGLTGDDLQEWEDSFVLGASPAATAIPEPASAALFAVSGLALLAARQRRRLK